MKNDEPNILPLIIGLAVIVLLCLLAGCARTVYVPTETVRTDTLRQTQTILLRDTIRESRILYQSVRDSVAPRFSDSGEFTGWDHFRFAQTTDLSDRERSLYEATIDSLRDVRRQTQTVTRTVEVERRLSQWQIIQIWTGRAAMAALAIYFSFLAFRRLSRR